MMLHEDVVGDGFVFAPTLAIADAWSVANHIIKKGWTIQLWNTEGLHGLSDPDWRCGFFFNQDEKASGVFVAKTVELAICLTALNLFRENKV